MSDETKGGVLARRSDVAALPQVAELRELCTTLAASGYFQDAREMAQAVVKVLAGREMGISPIASMTGVYVIKGRVSLSANLMASAIKRSGRYTYKVRRLDDEECTLDFFDGAELLGPSTFTLADAKRAETQNLTKFPRNMLFARAMSNGVKWYCPDVFGGPIYSPEELGARVDERGEPVDVTPTAERAPITMPQSVAEATQAQAQPEATAGTQAETMVCGICGQPVCQGHPDLEAEARQREQAEEQREKQTEQKPPANGKPDRGKVWNAVLRKAKAENKSASAVLKEVTGKGNMPELDDVQVVALGEALGV